MRVGWLRRHILAWPDVGEEAVAVMQTGTSVAVLMRQGGKCAISMGAAAIGQRVVGTERRPTHVICSRHCSLNTSGMCGGRASGNKITSGVAHPCMQ
jgi:hypothetical protein